MGSGSCASKGGYAVKPTILISGLLVVCISVAASAQEMRDMSKITCNQYLEYKISTPHDISMWLGGYYNAKRNNTVVDVMAFEKNSKKVQDYCLQNGEATVMQAVEAVLGVNK
jgi:hypothetical protein